MSALNCPVCHNSTIKCEVRIVFKKKVVGTFDSYLKAENYAYDNNYTPCVIKFIYECQKCRHEEVKLERVFVDSAPVLSERGRLLC